MNFNELRNVAHAQAKKSGWWDGPERSLQELLMLMVTEVAEATEAVRKAEPGLHYGLAHQDGQYLFGIPEGTKLLWPIKDGQELKDGKAWLAEPIPGNTKPEGEAIELVDAVIRLADLCGHMDWDWDLTRQLTKTQYATEWAPRVVGHSKVATHFYFTKMLTEFEGRGEGKLHLQKNLAIFSHAVEDYFVRWQWDFWQTVELKMLYNSTRAYRHGNKAL